MLRGIIIVIYVCEHGLHLQPITMTAGVVAAMVPAAGRPVLTSVTVAGAVLLTRPTLCGPAPPDEYAHTQEDQYGAYHHAQDDRYNGYYKIWS